MPDNIKPIANLEEIKRWSPVWIVPIVTALIGVWIIFYHIKNQGPEVTLITTSAEGIQPGKSAIKSRSVDIGMVDSVILSDDLSTVVIKARLKSGMEKLLSKNSVFWVVRPKIGREGISGLGTLLSGAYIELQPGNDRAQTDTFTLHDAPPLASLDAKGVRIKLASKQPGRLDVGDPVLFRGLRVGTVETSEFDTQARLMRYGLFIAAPYDNLVTSHVRFWLEKGVNFNMSTEGMRVEVGSLATLLSGGVSFDVPEGWDLGELAKNNADYELFSDKKSIQESLYVVHENFIVLFNESVRGLYPGAPVEFRGIRLGTVVKVPFFTAGIEQKLSINNDDYAIPVLIRIEPERLSSQLGIDFDIKSALLRNAQRGLRAALKSANMLTGGLYVDLDFYPNARPWQGPEKIDQYPVMPSEGVGLAQIQQKIMRMLDKFNALPLDSAVEEFNKTLQRMQTTLDTLNKLTNSDAMQALPADVQKTLQELNHTLRGVQPGSPAYTRLLSDMQRLEQALRELPPILRTLNQKSNALIFAAPASQDPQPQKAAK